MHMNWEKPNLRAHPSENHAVLKYGSTSTLSDFVQKIRFVGLRYKVVMNWEEYIYIFSRNTLKSKRYRGQRVHDRL